MNESDNSETEKLSWLDVPKSIWHFLGRNKHRWIGFNLLLFTIHFYELVPPFILGKIVDFFTNYHAGDSLQTFYFYALFVGISSIIVAFIRLSCKNRLDRIAIAAKTTARVEGFERLMDFSLQWHSKENSGNKVQRIFNGSQSISEWTQLTNNELFPVATSFIGVLLVFLFLSPIFLVFLIIYSLSYFAIEYIFNRKLGKLSDELNMVREKSSGKYIEGTGNMLAIKALGVEKDIHLKVMGSEEQSKNIEISLSNTGIKKWYSFQTLNGLALIVFLFLIAHQLVIGIISVGYILVFFTYFNNLRSATFQATDISSKVIQLKSNLLRMMPIFLEKPNIRTGIEKFPPRWKTISIHRGTFKYPSGQVGIKNLSFSFSKNERLGIAGSSGSGKSTLVKILLGLYELEYGEFKVGEKNYYSIAHEEITKNISIVLQETELFNLSIRENITLMREVDSELLNTAVDMACLQEMISTLPEGLDTLTGEKGYSLSGGERQRLGIARAICKNSPILLLDEATSSLDSRTEKKIMDKLFSTFGHKKTFIIVAHRISTLKDTDRVIVFEKGGIIEEGTFNNLIKNKDSHLGQLYALQSGT
ncbi:MAG: ABC transporter ATP-binding protein [Patescibacteria group bacterium]